MILLQGLPGIGKTTLIQKVLQKLISIEQNVDGFYTEEVKNGRTRIGFDVVTLKNERGILARKNHDDYNNKKLPTVGQYVVYLDSFEKLVLPIFENPKQILVIDEIGKMELFSKKFETAIKKVVINKNVKIIATVPLKGGPFLVKQLKENPENKLITVDETNRNHLLDEIVKLVT